MTVSNFICTLACFLIPFLWPLVSALYLLPAEEIRKILPRAFIESTLIALSVTFTAVFVVVLCLGTQSILDVQRREPSIFWKLPGVMICVSFCFWGCCKITQHTEQLDHQKRGIDSEPEFAAIDKSKIQNS